MRCRHFVLLNILICIAQQCFRNPTAGGISPPEGRFHPPQADFTPVTDRDFTLPQEGSSTILFLQGAFVKAKVSQVDFFIAPILFYLDPEFQVEFGA